MSPGSVSYPPPQQFSSSPATAAAFPTIGMKKLEAKILAHQVPGDGGSPRENWGGEHENEKLVTFFGLEFRFRFSNYVSYWFKDFGFLLTFPWGNGNYFLPLTNMFQMGGLVIN